MRRNYMAASSFEIFKKLYEEGKYSKAFNSLKAVIRERKKNEKGVVRFTEEEAFFLWTSAQEQYQSKNYEHEAELCDCLFRDMAYVKSHPAELVEAGLCIAYNGQEDDYGKGMEYFEKAAVCTPHPSSYEAMKHLGFMHEQGQGVDVDSTKALSYYEQSANGGYPEGCYCFGVHYYDLIQANDINPENLEKAATWLERAAELGYNGDPELSKKRFESWKKRSEFHIGKFNEFIHLVAYHQQLAQTCSGKLNQIQSELAGNTVEKSGPAVVTPAVVDSVALVNSGSEKEEERSTQETMTPAVAALENSRSEKEEEKKEEVASKSKSKPTAQDLKKQGLFKADSSTEKKPPSNTDLNQNQSSGGWNPVGGGKRGRGR